MQKEEKPVAPFKDISVEPDPSKSASPSNHELSAVAGGEDTLERIRYSIDHVTNSVLWVGRNGKFIDVNSSACRNLGYTRKELLNMGVTDIDPYWSKEVHLDVWKEIKGRNVFLIESFHKKKTGEEFPVEVAIHFQRFGDVEYQCVLARDITQRRRTETILRENEARLRRIFDQSPIGAAIVGQDYYFKGANTEFCHFIGYREEELLSLTIRDITHPDYLETNLFNISRLQSGEIDHYQTEKKYIRKDGRTVWGRVSVRIIRDEKGDPLYHLPLIEDITERKKATEALRESAERYRSLVESTDDSIYLVDKDCRYLFVNKQYSIRLGCKISDIIGKSYSEYHSDEDTQRFFRQVEEVLETGRSVHYENKSRRDLRYYMRTLSPVKEANGRSGAVTVVSKDISDLKQAAAVLKDSLEDTKMFAYSVIHDLKSPAVGIHGLSRILKNHCENLHDNKIEKYCDLIMKGSEQLSLLVDKINVYISTKEKSLNLEPVNLDEVLRIVRDEFQNRFDARGIRWSAPDRMPLLTIDRLAIFRVFRNLIDNSLKYGGSELSEIKIGYDEFDEFHDLSLEDNGIGIKEESSAKIFQVFKRDETSFGIEGSGLGLAIVKEIMEQHRGRVWIEPCPEKGICFHLAFPKRSGSD